MVPGPPPRLPELRPELRLTKGAASFSGEPTWLIHDPVANRYVQIDLPSFETLAHWSPSMTADELVQHVNAAGRVSIDRDTLDRLLGFLYDSELTTRPPQHGWRSFAAKRAKRRHAPHTWLLHNYLFFRMPLWRPQAFLERTLPIARRTGSPLMQRLVLGLGLIGLYLVSRQWESYLGTYQDFASIEGALLIALTTAGIKSAHELGHAYTAAHYGCRVPTMGVAVMLMAPLLYTDVTDAWKLRDRRQRMHIDSAGVRVELSLASLALFAWPFLPEGPLKGGAFMLSAISLVTSLFINLNPFMRFDGYYLLTELLQVENLQPRAFALGRWQVREWLFDLRHPCPEEMSGGRRAILVVYAWGIWIYRLMLFTGIALLVYHYFFKVLGIVLFLVEIVIFVARPIYQELVMWLKLRRQIGMRRRSILTALAAAAMLLLAVVPWSTRVRIPAVAEAHDVIPVFVPRPARIVAVHVAQGQSVKAGAPIVTLAAPEIDLERQTTQARLALARLSQDRRGADSSDREASLINERTVVSLEAKLEGLDREEDALVVRASIDGLIVELDPELHTGRWINPREQLATIAGGEGLTIRGYVAERDLWRVAPGTTGRFVPETLSFDPANVAITSIAVSDASEIEVEALSSVRGGPIASMEDARRKLVPNGAEYAVVLSAPERPGTYARALRGVVLAEGKPESFVSRIWRQALGVLVRESGV
ncbi:MAG: HlyD family efflux transporter periplasmic adaptor subunit [Hyphomicrobiaceae bacterium]